MSSHARSPQSRTPSDDLDQVAELGQQFRVDAIRMSTAAGSGHPTSSLSAAELLAVLAARHLRYDWQHPSNPGNDHLVMSKGHASPLLYAMFKAAGVVSDYELMTTYRRIGSPWEGHPTPALPWVDVATGSLGQGLPDAVGIALAGMHLEKAPYRVWVLCGDSELAEGSMWEALDKAAYFRLRNLTVLVDVNRLGMRGPTELEWDLPAYARRVAAFGCRHLEVDGHDVAAIDAALQEAVDLDQPTVLLAKTRKGHGFTGFEDAEGWHGKVLPPDIAEQAIAELGGPRELSLPRSLPAACPPAPPHPNRPVTLPEYPAGSRIATRTAFGDTLASLGSALPRLVVVDGEVGNSTHADAFAAMHPERYFDVFTAEQQMVATAIGLSVRGFIPFAATFGAFLTRAHDFIRMAAVSRANIRLVGTHAGVEVGPDGASQMALEDLAMMRAVHGSTVLYPSDATSTSYLVQAMAERSGVVYLRATRGAYPVLYEPGEPFPIGGAKLLRSSSHDQVTLIGAGVTTHSCLEAAQLLETEGIVARVIDLYSVKPIDSKTLQDAAEATHGRLVVAEDHHPEGGLGDAVLAALNSTSTTARVEHLAVRVRPGSGSPPELIDEVGLGARHIVAASHRLLGGGS
ncbi:transketolase [Kribbella shirazensis]|uniref:Transketolase n=1 Tax=Kribbella shirazensis TaxID=1105143 RepID=A0A7X6A4T6_9ACTN|nr:transketolase [Kribbella shirazensis]NIK61340.1 transketolase [Kribbella shirazensis]